jgi:nucleoside-diphosphate-sugar epimerase
MFSEVAMKPFALLGAAGAIGRSIAAALNQKQIPYRVVGRHADRLRSEFGCNPLAELTTWNPDDPASVRAAVAGVDTLIYLVGVPYDQFELHPVLMQKALQGAIDAGVRQFLLIGTVYPYGLPQTPTVAETHPRNPHTFKGRMRKQQEDILLEAHANGRIRAAVLRLPDFYGPGVEASFLHSLFQAAANGGTANMIGPIDTPHEYVYAPDVGPVVLELAAHDGTWGKWWNFAGAGAITQQQIVEQVAALSPKPPRTRVAGKLAVRALGLFNPFMRELVEMHYLLTSPVLMDDFALHSLLGSVRKTPYSEGIRLTVEWYRRQALESRPDALALSRQ